MSWLAVGAAAVTVGSQLYAAHERKAAGDAQSKLLRDEATVRRGEGHYAAEEERRQAQYVESRARAVGAASGAIGVGLDRVEANIHAEGEYRALLRQYSADVEAQDLERQAKVAKKGGAAAGTAGIIQSGSTLLTQGGDLWDRYKNG